MDITSLPPENSWPDKLPNEQQNFWSYLEQLVATCPLVIDRPKGTSHPRYPEMVYPLDYGYLEGTRAMDGGGIDVWVGSLPGRTLGGVVLTVDLKKADAELKLLLGCTAVEAQVILDFLNGHFMQGYLVRRGEDLLSLLCARRSVRRFLERKVPEAVLQRVLEAATWAPSAHHRQPWRFAILGSPQARARLAEAMAGDFRRDLLADGCSLKETETRIARSRQRIFQAPAAILLCLDTTTLDPYPDLARQQADRLMAAQGVAMAGQNLLLAAYAEGLGSVWMCAPLFAPVTVRQALGLPGTWEPQGLILLGYPARTPSPHPRQLQDEIIIKL